MSKITLENMTFHAYHGCLEHEKLLGNTFLVTLALELDTESAGLSDELTDTLNYQLVYDLVKTEMQIPSKLIEHVGHRIAEKVFCSFTQVSALKLKVSKLNPPLGAKVEAVSFEIEKSK